MPWMRNPTEIRYAGALRPLLRLQSPLNSNEARLLTPQPRFYILHIFHIFLKIYIPELYIACQFYNLSSHIQRLHMLPLAHCSKMISVRC